MKRRDILAAIGAAAWPAAARAQPQRGTSARVGVLTTTSEHDPEWKSEKGAFLEAMSGFGWMEGRNLHVDYRFGAGDQSRLAEAGRELVNLKPDVLLTRSPTSVKALLAETRRIPIVFVSVSDPVGERFAASLARPGGNVTGFTNVEPTMAGKWLELLREIAPGVGRVGILYNPRVQPRWGRCREPTDVTPHYAPFPTYKATEFSRARGRRRALPVGSGASAAGAAPDRVPHDRPKAG